MVNIDCSKYKFQNMLRPLTANVVGEAMLYHGTLQTFKETLLGLSARVGNAKHEILRRIPHRYANFMCSRNNSNLDKPRYNIPSYSLI
jgi:hypothetical protein